MKTAFETREASSDDLEKIYELYRAVAKIEGGIARVESEITLDYVRAFLSKSLQSGIVLVISNPDNPKQLVAEIHAYSPGINVFSHVLNELTIVVHPEFQGHGLGKQIFKTFLEKVNHRREILRVELIARESNQKAIVFYESLGFKKEGRFEKRISSVNGNFEADIPMAWMKPGFEP